MILHMQASAAVVHIGDPVKWLAEIRAPLKVHSQQVAGRRKSASIE